MTEQPLIFRNIAVMRRAVAQWRAAGEAVALIPTMGALHAGHISLIKASRENARRAIVSIFVNPTQFAPNEDFSAYPRTFEADLAKLAEAGCDGCFAPMASEMYPEGFSTKILPGGPALAGLEDRFRPDHFAGMAQVVAKLLNQSQADCAFFGEKDFQQLAVIRRMAADLDIPTAIFGVPTLREPDGLAMSSRNVYLSAQERAQAVTLSRVLRDSAKAIRAGAPVVDVVARAGREITAAGFALDYFEARQAQSLAPIAGLAEGPIRLLVAARLGRTRLIDNWPVE
ncbi:pantoate--beta-alanine ligase [Rhodoblastus acidophilus]|uniref:Pantothenate synthetase n=1 Tax=Candidatus Rhodoblastus alkanivorans TaxID=2954117 RepID=A0ABS9Z633_9HYPH|nr:pantoate--beta-alanine ligase [Candidatus Rhodoblastus alkanivorans]MCI4678680.1 pantoate--beta-alanine ligase [Candidatus Rhodoblastus alkanivorans]MCI4683089.1 pantoate--beta-alanine ligase [Candidatus Rhodoblastus alkanivorans]MDI4640400.1 pantoate--beta-alanine ligase [Rhodoblastus acidophilus]